MLACPSVLFVFAFF